MDGARRSHHRLCYRKPTVPLTWLTPGANARAGQRAKKDFNLVMMHPDATEGGVESWTAEGNMDKMKEYYKGWSPTLVTLSKSPCPQAEWTQCSKASGACSVNPRLEADGP